MAYAFKRQEWVRVDTSTLGVRQIDITTTVAYVAGDVLFFCCTAVGGVTPQINYTGGHIQTFVRDAFHTEGAGVQFGCLLWRATIAAGVTIPVGSTFRISLPTGLGSVDPETVAHVLLVFGDPAIPAISLDYLDWLPSQAAGTGPAVTFPTPGPNQAINPDITYTGTAVDSTPTGALGSQPATAHAQELLIGVIHAAANTTYTPESGQGWNVIVRGYSDTNIFSTHAGTLIVQWKIVSTTGVYYWKGSLGTSTRWGMVYESLTPFAAPVQLGGDLVATPAALLRSYAKADGTAWVDTAPLVGTPWTAVQIASALPSDAFPTLCVFRDEHRHYVFAFFHDASGATQVFVTENDGGSWVGISSKTGLKFPRGVALTGCVLLAGHDGTHLKVYRTEDFFVTLTEVFSTTVGAELVGLRADRRGHVHMVTPAMGHSTSTDGVTWTAAGSLGGGTLGAFDYEFPHGAIFYWAGSILEVQPTDEKYDALAGSPTSLAALALPVQQLGATYDRNGVAWLFGQKDDASKHIYWSRDEAAFTEVP